MKLSVVGLGKAGLPLAAVIADAGLTVVGVDKDEARVTMINSGGNPIPEEAGMEEILKRRAGKNLTATTDAAGAAKEATVHIVIVPLFIDAEHNPDFSMLQAAFENIGKGLKKNDLVVLETTVPVGTTEKFVKNILEKISGMKAGTDFYLAYSPERIMTGVSISRFREFPKLVGGIDSASSQKAFDVYAQFANPIRVSNARTAELAKVAEGVYRDVNIALANELLQVSEHYDIDFYEMKDATKHEYCNILQPGFVGGHCIPVYPWFLIHDLDVPLTHESRKVNEAMLQYYLEKVKEKKPTNVGIVGLSYREGVKETHFSKATDFIALLKKEGYTLFGIDPLFSKEEIKQHFGVEHLGNFDDMDVVVNLHDDTTYLDQLQKIKERVIDLKHIL